MTFKQIHFQWQNPILLRSIYPVRETKLRDFILTYDEIDLVQKEIGGGRISKEQIDTIGDSQNTKITISGLTQETFEYFIDTYGNRFQEIIFWKCPIVKELSKLESLVNIESISYFWNQKAETLWDF